MIDINTVVLCNISDLQNITIEIITNNNTFTAAAE